MNQSLILSIHFSQQQIADQLGISSIVNNFQQFVANFNSLPQAIAQAIPADIIIHNLADDVRVQVTNVLASITTKRGTLVAFVPYVYKQNLINEMISGSAEAWLLYCYFSLNFIIT